MLWVYLGLLVLHILCCLITFMGIQSRILNVHKYMIFVVLFLPFWGFLIVLVLHFQVAFDADNAREIQVEKMQLESEIYKSVIVEEKKNDAIVPIEEALIINNARERRELIMDVLNDNPKEYIEFLQKAGNNDDTEVVHYAVTAMVEISKEVDYTLQQLERQYAAEPDNMSVLTEYCEFLWNCLEQNIMQGQVEVMNRKFFNDLVEKKLAVCDNLTDYTRLAKNCLALKQYSKAGEAVEKVGKLWPKSEEYILLQLEYYSAAERGDKIKKLLDELENSRTYLSARTKEAIAFWNE